MRHIFDSMRSSACIRVRQQSCRHGLLDMLSVLHKVRVWFSVWISINALGRMLSANSKSKLTRFTDILRCVHRCPPSMILRYLSVVCILDVDRFGFLTGVAPRMWTLSLLCALFGSSSNLFFSLRYPSVFISPVIALVIVHPLGRAWDMLLKRDDDPVDDFNDGVRNKSMANSASTTRTQRLRLWLAQGKWNEKEHACVYIGSNVSFGFAFATDVRRLRCRSREKI